MKEIYKVRKIEIDLYSSPVQESQLSIECEFGIIIEKEGVLFLETHIFDKELFDKIIVELKSIKILASAKMLSFSNIEIETSLMEISFISTNENKVSFLCYNYITIKDGNKYNTHSLEQKHSQDPSRLLRIDFWGLNLIIKSQHSSNLIVGDAPFEITFYTDKKSGITSAYFPCNYEVAHNELTEELFNIFRDSLIGYFSLINGARVQITKEYYNSFTRIYSYDKIENISYSSYLCGSIRVYDPDTSLFEFDNYVRWNNVLNINKFVQHLSTAQQVLSIVDRAFILILAFEGLCEKYQSFVDKERIPSQLVSKGSFQIIKKELLNILENHNEISTDVMKKLSDRICNLNSNKSSTNKFKLIIDDLNIEMTEKINTLFKKVRSTLVHEATLNEYEDYQLLSELIREIILRLINSKLERYSSFVDKMFKGESPNLSYNEYIIQKHIKIEDSLFAEYDRRFKYWIKQGK